MVGRQALEIEFLKGAMRSAPQPRSEIRRDFSPNGLCVAQRLFIGRAGPGKFLDKEPVVLNDIGVSPPPLCDSRLPRYGLAYLFSHGISGFLVLGGVFLCVTGAEALYADMGHVGKGPIQLSWFAIVFPSLILNYAGQAALVLDGAPTDGNIFYRLCPQSLLLPLIALATLATIIASQSIITGAFSMTRQAILLGWLPRLQIKQTSSKGYGQIYVGVVNFLLMIATIGLTIGFGKSDNLAAAYGIAVSLTMLMTSVLLFIAMREIWGWNLIAAAGVAAFFLVIDGAFFLANLTKIAEGGYVPLLLAIGVYGVMWIWHRGASAVTARLQAVALRLQRRGACPKNATHRSARLFRSRSGSRRNSSATPSRVGMGDALHAARFAAATMR
jgi:KUP system potassium uptake protein